MRLTRSLHRPLAAAVLAALLAAPLVAQNPSTTARHNVRTRTLAIRNATIVDGNGTPARGPADIIIDGDTISRIVWLDPVAMRGGNARRVPADAEIDATGKFVLPGLINAHAHLQRGRAGFPQSYDYTL